MSYGVCWKIALVSELFGAQSGLGYLMLQASVGDVVTVVATCLIIVLLFTLGEALIINLIARTLRDIAQAEAGQSMIPKSVQRFSEKIMLKWEPELSDKDMPKSAPSASDSIQRDAL